MPAAECGELVDGGGGGEGELECPDHGAEGRMPLGVEHAVLQGEEKRRCAECTAGEEEEGVGGN